MLRVPLLAASALLVAASCLAVGPTARSSAGTAPDTTARPTCGGERPAKLGGGRYSCSFEDNFGGSELDGRKWAVQETALSGMTTATGDCYVNDPDNVAVRDGSVRLRAHVEPAPFVCKSPYGDYTATRTVATIASWSRFSQTYGRFEFRARFAQHNGPGLGSGLWLYPQNHKYGGWPHSGEIDVAEWFSGQAQNVYPSLHYAGAQWPHNTGFDCLVPTASTTYHRYAVEWTPTVMRFFYDGNLCYTHKPTPAAPLASPQPFDHPFYLVMTHAFGAGWNAVDANTPTSSELVVDWVRVWK